MICVSFSTRRARNIDTYDSFFVDTFVPKGCDECAQAYTRINPMVLGDADFLLFGIDRCTVLPVSMFIILKNVLAREACPFPWSNVVADELFEKRTKGQRAVIAIGQQDHARSTLREADEIVLDAGYPSFFKKGYAVARSREQAPTETG